MVCPPHLPFYRNSPSIEYRLWTGLVFNKWQYSIYEGLSYCIILLQVATCPSYIFGSRLAIVYSILLSKTEMHCTVLSYTCLTAGAYQLLVQVRVDVYKRPVRKSPMNLSFIQTHVLCSQSRAMASNGAILMNLVKRDKLVCAR